MILELLNLGDRGAIAVSLPRSSSAHLGCSGGKFFRGASVTLATECAVGELAVPYSLTSCGPHDLGPCVLIRPLKQGSRKAYIVHVGLQVFQKKDALHYSRHTRRRSSSQAHVRSLQAWTRRFQRPAFARPRASAARAPEHSGNRSICIAKTV